MAQNASIDYDNPLFVRTNTARINADMLKKNKVVRVF